MIRASRILLFYLTTLSLVLATSNPIPEEPQFKLDKLSKSYSDLFNTIDNYIVKERIYRNYQAQKVSEGFSFTLACFGGLHTFYFGKKRILWLALLVGGFLLDAVCHHYRIKLRVSFYDNKVRYVGRFLPLIIFCLAEILCCVDSYIQEDNDKVFKKILEAHGHKLS